MKALCLKNPKQAAILSNKQLKKGAYNKYKHPL